MGHPREYFFRHMLLCKALGVQAFSVRLQRGGNRLDNECVVLLTVLSDTTRSHILYFMWYDRSCQENVLKPLCILIYLTTLKILVKPQSYVNIYLLMSRSNINQDSCIFDEQYRIKRWQFLHTSLFLYICFLTQGLIVQLREFYLHPLLYKYCFKGIYHHVKLNIDFCSHVYVHFPLPPKAPRVGSGNYIQVPWKNSFC